MSNNSDGGAADRLGLFDEFHHHPIEGLRVGKSHPSPFRAGHRLLIDQLQSGRLGQSQRRLDILDLQTDVVQPLPPLVDGSIDGRAGFGGGHELDMGPADVKEGHLGLLAGHFLNVLALEPQLILEVRLGLFEVPDGHRDVVQLKFHAYGISRRPPSCSLALGTPQ